MFAEETAEEIESRWDALAASLTERFPMAAARMHEDNEMCWLSATSPRSTGARSGHQPAEIRERRTVRCARQCGNQTTHVGRRIIPRRRLDHPPGGSGAAGTARALAAGGVPYALRRQHVDCTGAR